MDVSIIIVNYNTSCITEQCISSIYEKTSRIEFEVILVDNASKDNSIEIFSSDNRIIYKYLPSNIGFGAASNLGLSYATGRNILFLNSDTILRNNAVKILSDYLDTNAEVGACGGNLFDINGSPTHSYRLRDFSFWSILDNRLHCIPSRLVGNRDIQFNHSKYEKEVAYITGADLMVKKSVLEKAGGFSRDFFMYFEDAELCWRIRKDGLKIISVPSAEITHLEGGSSKKKTKQSALYYDESKKKFLQLTGGSFNLKMSLLFEKQ